MPRRKAALELAEAKKKTLVEYTKPRRLKQLQSEVEKARGEELARQADWELAKAREARLEQAIKQEAPTIDVKRILALIERAIPIEEQIRGKIEQIAKDGEIPRSAPQGNPGSDE